MKEFLAGLDRYWFDARSASALGVFRILFGLAATFSLLVSATSVLSFFTEDGYVPRWLVPIFLAPNELYGLSLPRINVLSGAQQTGVTLAVFCATLVAAFLTTVGAWTRVAKWVLAIGVVSLHHRNPFVLHGGDTVLRVMALYLAISPCERACSLDRLWGLARGRIAAGPVLVSIWPQRLVAYNTALVYFTTVWLKYFGETWREGSATWYTARLAEFERFWVPQFLKEPPMTVLASYGTLAVEFGLATLVFYRPLRKYVLIAGLALHGYIEYSMNIPSFAFLICSCYICFYDGEEVEDWAKRFGERWRRFRVRVLPPVSPESRTAIEAADAYGWLEWGKGGEPGLRPVWKRIPWLWWLPGPLWRWLFRINRA
jgi:hypothetical protein